MAKIDKKEWQDNLDDFLDIAQADALNKITIEEVWQFLIAQRQEGRSAILGSVTKLL